MWSNAYIGLPFREKGRDRSGLDCYGLVYLAFATEQRIAIPRLDKDYACLAEREEIAALFDAGNSDPWRPIAEGDERPFDVVLFRRGRITSHIGIVVEPGRMLHIQNGIDCGIERYDVGAWRTRLVGIRRHRELIR